LKLAYPTIYKYSVEVEHNATISYSGTLQKISFFVNFSSTKSKNYSIMIYDFSNNIWTSCQNISASANTWYGIWCNISSNPSNYVSSDSKVRVRINSTMDYNQATLKEEYVQFYVGYSVGYLEVELISPSSQILNNIVQNTTFIVNATVICRGAPCGNVYGTVMYNLTSAYPDTPINVTYGDKPFFINEAQASAIKACPNNPLNTNAFCNLTWIINASGNINTDWKIGVFFNSSYSEVPSNTTKNASVSIIGCVEDFSLTFSSIDFGILIPNTYNNPAPGNSLKLYNITLAPGACNLDFYIKGDDLIGKNYGTILKISNVSVSNSSNDVSKSFRLSQTNQLLFYNLTPASYPTYYWIDLPPIYADQYIGTIYITGVRNGQTP